MQLFLDADTPVVVRHEHFEASAQHTVSFHRQNENGTTTMTMLVVMGPTITDADYRAIGQAVMAVFVA
jgi:hypothetical protein